MCARFAGGPPVPLRMHWAKLAQLAAPASAAGLGAGGGLGAIILYFGHPLVFLPRSLSSALLPFFGGGFPY